MTTKLAIADLYPSELKVISSTVDKYKKNYAKDAKKVALPTVAKIDGCWIVRDGNNRVYAAKNLGIEEIEVKEDTPIDTVQIASLKQALDDAKTANYKGFKDLPVVNSNAERMNHYL